MISTFWVKVLCLVRLPSDVGAVLNDLGTLGTKRETIGECLVGHFAGTQPRPFLIAFLASWS